MNILIPMAGEGNRFKESGYSLNKPSIPVTFIQKGQKMPMALCASLHIPGILNKENKVIYIQRHIHKTECLEKAIKDNIPHAQFLTIDHVTEGQAETCLFAQEKINNKESLFIASCDSGGVINTKDFQDAKQRSDVIIFTQTKTYKKNFKLNAHSWIKPDTCAERVKHISTKKHFQGAKYATTGIFWFSQGDNFIKAVNKMIQENDTRNKEYYIDQSIQYAIEKGLKVIHFPIEYFSWGTPEDLEEYENTLSYWKNYIEKEDWLQR